MLGRSLLVVTSLGACGPTEPGPFGSSPPDEELSLCGAPRGQSRILRGFGLLSGADHFDCELPVEVEGAPQFTVHQGTTTIAQGGRTGLLVDWEGPEPVAGRGIVVSLEGEPGWFRADADRPDRPFPVELWARPDAPVGPTTLRLALDDGTGNASSPHPGRGYTIPLEIVAAGSGDVQVTVSWDGDADLDLAVIDPLDQVLWWGSEPTPENGSLDLDSNAGCDGGARNESIHWPVGLAPEGNYRVMLNMWDACGSVAETRFRLTILQHGDPVDSQDGFIAPSEADPTDGPPSFEVTTFLYPDS